MICIRFIADGTIESRLIRWRTLGIVSHVEYVVDDVATFGARLSGGIGHRPVDYCSPSFDERYTFPGIEASYAEAVKLNGQRYDFSDILDLLVGWHPKGYDPREAICSVLVGYSNRRAWALGTAPALVNPSVPTWQLTPALLYGAVTEMVGKVR